MCTRGHFSEKGRAGTARGEKVFKKRTSSVNIAKEEQKKMKGKPYMSYLTVIGAAKRKVGNKEALQDRCKARALSRRRKRLIQEMTTKIGTELKGESKVEKGVLRFACTVSLEVGIDFKVGERGGLERKKPLNWERSSDAAEFAQQGKNKTGQNEGLRSECHWNGKTQKKR